MPAHKLARPSRNADSNSQRAAHTPNAITAISHSASTSSRASITPLTRKLPSGFTRLFAPSVFHCGVPLILNSFALAIGLQAVRSATFGHRTTGSTSTSQIRLHVQQLFPTRFPRLTISQCHFSQRSRMCPLSASVWPRGICRVWTHLSRWSSCFASAISPQPRRRSTVSSMPAPIYSGSITSTSTDLGGMGYLRCHAAATPLNSRLLQSPINSLHPEAPKLF